MPLHSFWAMIVLSTFLLVAVAPSALAQSSTPTFKSGFERVKTEGTTSGVKSYDTIGDFIIAILKVVAAVVAALALGALVIGAILYITSLGEEGKTAQAKRIIMYALIGLLVLGAAGIVVNVAINIIRAGGA